GVWSHLAVTESAAAPITGTPITGTPMTGAPMTGTSAIVPPASAPLREWPAGLHGLVGRVWDPRPAGRQDRWVVRGGPGSGKTSLIADVVRAAVTDGVGMDGVLVLTGSATAGAALLEEVTRGL